MKNYKDLARKLSKKEWKEFLGILDEVKIQNSGKSGKSSHKSQGFQFKL